MSNRNRGSRATGTPSTQGLILFAGTAITIGGVFHAQSGVVAIVDGGFSIAIPNYVFWVDITVWEGAPLVLGLLVSVVGLTILRGREWGRIASIVCAFAGAITNFAFIPMYPLRSVLIMTIDALVIWAMTFRGRELLP